MSVLAEVIYGLGFSKVDTRELDKTEKKAKESAKKMAEDFKKISGSITSTFRQVGTVVLGAVTGVAAFVERNTAAADTIAKTARVAGMTSDEYQRLAFAAERSGASVEHLRISTQFLNKNMSDAAAGGAAMFTAGLKVLGVSLESLQNATPEEKIGILADALQRVEDPSQRAALSARFFGEEAGPRLASLLAGGSKGIKALGDEAESLGRVIDKDTLAAAEAFQDELTNMKSALGGLAIEIANELVPTFKEGIAEIQNWVKENRELIKQKVADFFQRVVRVGRQLFPVLQQIGSLVGDLARVVGGLANALGPSGLVIAITGAKAALSTLGTAASGAAGPIGLLASALALAVSELERLDKRNAEREKQMASRIKDTKDLLKLEKHLTDEEFVRRQKLVRQIEEHQRRIGEGATHIAVPGQPTISREDEIIRLQKEVRRIEDAGLKRAPKDGPARTVDPSGLFTDEEIALYKATGIVPDKRSRAEIEAALAATNPNAGKKADEAQKARDRAAAVQQAREQFLPEIERLAALHGLSAGAVQASIEVAADSIQRFDVKDVQRQAALGRLGASAGKDFTTKSNDPLLSELLGEDVPDIELSAIARGTDPQVLISNITNNFEFHNEFDIDGAGDPARVGDQVAIAIRDAFQGSLERATKTAKVVFAR